MDELYRLQYSSISSCPVDDSNFVGDDDQHQHLVLTAPQLAAQTHEMGTGLEMSDIIKAQIANHPFYPNLLSAYIECRKVGAPPEMASLLEEISSKNLPISTCNHIGTDPELDDFMRSFCEVLLKYKEELSKPFNEATSFLSSIETQLSDLCRETLPSVTYSNHSADDGGGGGPSDEDIISCGEDVEAAIGSQDSICIRQGDHELKEMLMRKYSGYLSSLRKQFLKKRKKGKLPKDAINALTEWWNSHYRWPYPTEDEKKRLSEMTGLEQKQINNWFINQRKRHWRPSEDMRFALMEGITNAAGSTMFTGGTS